jgi:hypothetical protein
VFICYWGKNRFFQLNFIVLNFLLKQLFKENQKPAGVADRGLQEQQEMETKAKAIKNVPEDGDDAEKQLQQPPRKVARKIKGGQMREYIFLDSVNSMEELDKLRFKVIYFKKIKKDNFSVNK